MAHNAQRVMLGLAIASQAIFGGLPASAQLSVPPPKSGSAALEPLAPLSPFLPPGGPASSTVTGPSDLISVSAGVTDTLPESTIGPSGGQVTSRDGRVALQFSPGAIRIARTISGSLWVRSVQSEEDTQADTAPILMRLVLGPDGDFSAPVTVSLRLGDLFATADRAGAAVPSLRYLRPTRVTRTVPAEDGTPIERVFRENQIEPVAQQYDPQSGILTATLRHFSNYDVVLTQPQAPEAWKPVPNAARVSLFRGAAAAVVPIKAPAAPGAPALSLQYSSASAEEWTGANVGQSYNGGLAWVVGTGWQMNISRISRTTQQDNCEADGYHEADHYTLVLNGATYSLVSAGGGSYVTKEYSPLRIDLCANTATSCGGVPISTQTSPSGSYWQVRAADGTRYLFGIDVNSRDRLDLDTQNAGPSKYRHAFLRRVYAGQIDTGSLAEAQAWTAEYEYEESAGDQECGKLNTVWQTWYWWFATHNNRRPKTIRYGSPVKVDGTPSGLRYALRFGYDSASSRLTNVWSEVQEGSLTTPIGRLELSGQAVRMFTDPPGNPNMWIQVLSSAVESAWNGAGYSALPANTFEYAIQGDSYWPNNRNRLVRMSNGYGGSHEFDYAADDSAGEYYWHRQVTAARVMGGLGNTSTTAYAYADRCVGGFKDDNGAIHPSPCQDYGEVFFGANTVPQIIGFGSVVETIYNNGELNGSVAHKFNVTDPRLAGREYETRRRDGAGTVLQARQTDEEAATGLSGQPAVVYVARTRETREYPFGDIGSAPMKRTRTNDYTGLGSPKIIQEYGLDSAGDERTTFIGYAPGPIAGELPVWEALYTGILTAEVASPARLSSTRLYYDYAEAGRANTALSGFNVVSQTPARGRLTAVEHGLAAFGAGFPPALWTMANYGYDRIGNVTVLTDAGLNVSFVNYDSSGQFVLGSHNALGQATNYAYYGINGESLTNTVGAAQPYGALKSTTDPNGATVMYAYDALGRLRKVAQPGDTLADPSEEWRYYDGIETAWTTTATGFSAGPYLSDHLVRGVSGGGWTSATLATFDRTIYDGLGRAIQTQTRAGQGWAWADCNDNPRKTLGAEVIQSTLYDPLGRPAIQTVPYTQTQYEYCATAGRVDTPYVAMPQTRTYPSGTGLAAVYYNGMNFETPVLGRTDATVDFNWGSGSPGGGVWSDQFSARWTGWVRVDTSATYTFYPAGDDGIRLWINGQLMVDQWHDQGLTEYPAAVALQAGVAYQLIFEYYENSGGAQARLKWASPTLAKQVIPAANLYATQETPMVTPVVTPAVPYARTAYDALGRPITVTAPDGSASVTRYGVDATAPGYAGTNLVLKTSIDPNGHQKQQVSDGLGRLVRVREFTGTDGSVTLYGQTSYAYDAADRLTTVTDTLGNVTTIAYDGLGRKVGMVDPDMGAWSYAYNALGQLTSQTDAKGQTSVFTYDALGRMTGRGAREIETTVYEAESAPYAHVSGCGSAVTNGGATAWIGACESYFTVGPYSAPLRAGPGQSAVFRLAITSTRVANDSTIVAKIDVFDWTTGQTLALRELARSAFGGGIGNYREYELSFDSTGRETHQLEYRVWGYSGNETIAHDRTTLLWAGPQASYLYDQGNNGIGRRTRMTDTTGYAAWAYDARGRVITATKQINPNPAAYATLFGYDAANRLITTTYPGGEVVTNTFDGAGQPYGLYAGGSPIVKSATYNALGQPRSIDFGNGVSQRRYYGGLDTTLYNVTYGKMRQLCVAETSLGECADDAAPGRGGTGTMLFNTVYGYDASGNVTAVDDRTSEASQINEYVYDSLDRLTEWRKVTSWSPYSATTQEAYTYSPIGNMTSKAGVTITNGTAKSGVISTLGFEAYSVYSPTDPGGSFVTPQTFGSWSFEGSAGVSYNNTHLTSGNPAAPEGMQVGFIQGAARMTATVSGFTIGQTYRIGFMMAQRVNYGLPQTVTARVGNVALGTFTAPTGVYGSTWSGPFTATATSQAIALWGAPDNGEDRMAFIDRVVVATAGPHAAVGMSNGNSYVYDPNGNMIIRREVSGTQTFTYTQAWTVDNRLASVVKSDVTGTILATTTIAYDGDGLRVKKTDPSGTTLYLGTVEVLITGTTQVTTSYYAFGGAMVAMRTTATATLTYLQGDHLGSVSLTTNAAGQKVSEQRYKPYGEVRWSSGSEMPTEFTFTGQRAGPANYVGSLMDYNARFYSPALGRFVSADSIVPSTSRSSALNRYSYVIGNPLSMRDPTGHWFETVFDLVMAAWSFAEFAEEPNLENTASLVLDVAAVVVPIPAVGGLMIKGAKRVDKIVNLVRVANRVDNVADGLRWVDRFAGASPDILNGVNRLENSLNAGKIPQFKHGLTKQLERAYDLFKQGKLKGVEVTEAANRFDFILIGDDVVEFKYWTASSLKQYRDALLGQLQNYKRTGKKLHLELGKTKTDPIGATELDELRKFLDDNGLGDVDLSGVDFNP